MRVRFAIAALVLWIAAHAGQLAMTRHFQVDEFQNMSNVTFLAGWRGESFATTVAPWNVWLGWALAPLRDDTRALMLAGRACFAALFFLNVALLVWVVPRAWQRGRVLPMLLLAATSDLLWRHGFEIRHEVLIVTTQLVMLGLTLRARLAPTPRLALAAAFVGAMLMMNTLKGGVYAALYGVIFLGVALTRPGARTRASAVGLVAASALGVLLAGLLAFGTAWLSGHAATYWAWLGDPTRALEGLEPSPFRRAVYRVPPPVFWMALVGARAAFLRRRHGPSRPMSEIEIVLLYAAVSVFVYAANPRPYAYNLLTLVVPMILAGYHGWRWCLARVGMVGPHARRARWVSVAAAVVLLLDWGAMRVFARYMSESNRAQLSVIAAAEALTGRFDPVLDGAGLVLTRPVPGRDWLLHSALMAQYRRGERARFSGYLTEDWPPVVVTNYRWRWLPKRERRPLRENYVSLSRDMHVLGGRVRAGGESGELLVRRAGRYGFFRVKDGETRIDGRVVHLTEPLLLSAGRHSTSANVVGARYAWVGPRLGALPVVEQGDATLFVSLRGDFGVSADDDEPERPTSKRAKKKKKRGRP